jgi:hypothetical protein
VKRKFAVLFLLLLFGCSTFQQQDANHIERHNTVVNKRPAAVFVRYLFNDTPIINSAVNQLGAQYYEYANPVNYRQKDSVKINPDSSHTFITGYWQKRAVHYFIDTAEIPGYKDLVRICGDSACDSVYFTLDSAKLSPFNVYPDEKYGPDVFLQSDAIITDTIVLR